MSVRAYRSTSWALALVSVLLLNLCTGFITLPSGRLETLRCLPNEQPVRDLDASYAASFNQGLYPEQLIYLDDDIIVVDKPANIQTAPGFVSRDCLASTIAQMFSLPRVDRMIVHRLDYATSGVVVFARNDDSLKALHTQLRQQRVYKAYVAVVSGRLSSFEGEINLPLGKDPDRGPPFCRVDPLSPKAKISTTVWRAVAVGASNSLVRLRPATGRTHQLRLHLAAIGHPILGDFFYAPDAVLQQAERLLLHAEELRILHPRTGQPLAFRAPHPFQL
eukprot:CAMPEP_0173174442 /NCGR_PEP_ID=MMETSP1141-20130122/3356_1 /TAXON_ID=483371 /ORGANISM="non described non described, Strain CCMP2298" /LENGTH=276 /DNA_ID=CAMNT_0014096569 /DNA_START=173 /DNA_END=999 /DNA_ORIENTATION=-